MEFSKPESNLINSVVIKCDFTVIDKNGDLIYFSSQNKTSLEESKISCQGLVPGSLVIVTILGKGFEVESETTVFEKNTCKNFLIFEYFFALSLFF